MKHHSFLALSLTLLLCVAGFGCRLGNQMITRAPQSSGPVTLETKYYATQPKSLTFYTTTRGTLLQKSASLTQIPNEIAKIVTQPVALAIEDIQTGKGSLSAPLGKRALPIIVSGNGSLAYFGSTSPKTLWLDSNCKRHLEITEGGNLFPSPSPTSLPGISLPLAGSLAIRIRVATQFTGNCGPSFQLIAKCYDNPNDCDGESADQNQKLQELVQSFLAPYIQSNALKIEEIPDIENYGYEVSYE